MSNETKKLSQDDIIELWTDALESGKYKQCTSVLSRNGRYCCLGVLCELYCENVKNIKQIIITDYEDGPRTSVQYGQYTQILGSEVMNWVGLRGNSGNSVSTEDHLSDLNDNGTTFKEIAQIIKTNKDNYFNQY